MLSDERLAEIKAYHAATTGERWAVIIREQWAHYCNATIESADGDPIFSAGDQGVFGEVPDFEFVVAVHRDIPDLIAEVERLKRELEAMRQPALKSSPGYHVAIEAYGYDDRPH